jgi:protein-S-isoprenylcysteine O-methyltransferase Ste14
MGAVAMMRLLGVVAFAAGLAIRWYSIVHLGRFFTVNVAIAANHRLIDTGPYRFVRHPSYTGALMAFLGLALCLANWASLIVMLVPIFLVFLRRMRVEEGVLLQAFGHQYRDYMQRTKRLIPAVY